MFEELNNERQDTDTSPRGESEDKCVGSGESQDTIHHRYYNYHHYHHHHHRRRRRRHQELLFVEPSSVQSHGGFVHLHAIHRTLETSVKTSTTGSCLLSTSG
ncbi:hypothetical protein PV326_003905 [Microctonus aethiopoides]|nr:hypothetical protein PV326_003905 [Microctonus aethiopoides]